MNKIIGQTGDKSNANKLLTWLKNWHKHRKLGTKPVPSCKLWKNTLTEAKKLYML